MPSKDKISEETYLTCKHMLYGLLKRTHKLGTGYVIQLIYELAVVVLSYEDGRDQARDSCVRAHFNDAGILVTCRNIINHNSYNSMAIVDTIQALLVSRIVERVYLKIFGKAPGYIVFEAFCYEYIKDMKDLWGVKEVL